MSFFDKKINVSRFTFEPLALEEIKSKLANFTAPKLNSVETEVVTGWSNAEDLTSSDFANSVIAEKYLYVNMRIAVKKLPAGLFKMLTAQKFAEYKKNTGRDIIPSKIKKELKEEVAQKLLPMTAPTVKNIWVIFTDDGNLFAGTASSSDKQLLYDLIYRTLDIDIEAVVPDKIISTVPVQEFFTDVFRVYDTMELCNSDYMVHSPFSLESIEESPCVKTGLSGFNLEDSAELKAALKEGKLFSKIRLSANAGLFEKYLIAGFVDENDIFTFTMEQNGSLCGVVLPECETLSLDCYFVERIELLKSLCKLADSMMGSFAKKAALHDYEILKREWIEGR